jgi:hypothetical protein
MRSTPSPLPINTTDDGIGRIAFAFLVLFTEMDRTFTAERAMLLLDSNRLRQVPRNLPLKHIVCPDPRELAVLQLLHQPSGPDWFRLAVMARQFEDIYRPVQGY